MKRNNDEATNPLTVAGIRADRAVLTGSIILSLVGEMRLGTLLSARRIPAIG
jgi:hypothetical protein